MHATEHKTAYHSQQNTADDIDKCNFQSKRAEEHSHRYLVHQRRSNQKGKRHSQRDTAFYKADKQGNGRAGTERSNGSENGSQYILQPVFEWLEKDGQHYIATREGKYGWSDRKGEWIIEPQYRNALRFFDAELAPVQLSGGRWGYINKKGKIKIKEQFDEAYPFVGNKALVKVGPYYGFINGDGKYVINPGYTWISPDYISNAVNGEPYYTKVQTDLK